MRVEAEEGGGDQGAARRGPWDPGGEFTPTCAQAGTSGGQQSLGGQSWNWSGRQAHTQPGRAGPGTGPGGGQLAHRPGRQGR